MLEGARIQAIELLGSLAGYPRLPPIPKVNIVGNIHEGPELVKVFLKTYNVLCFYRG